MRNTRTLILAGGVEVKELGHRESTFAQRQNISVPVSGFTDIRTPGGKCFHGVYIPAGSPDPQKALYCSLCYPFELAVIADWEYKA